MSYSPSTAFQSAGGTVAVDATVVFSDAGSDVTTMRITSSTGADLTVPRPSLSGVQNGATATNFSLPTDKVGKVTFELWLVDGRGSVSNRLSGSIDVVAAAGPAPDHAPLISGLSYSPFTATQAASGNVTVSATVAYADTGGDVSTMRIMSGAGSDLTAPMPALSGVRNGASTTTFVVPVDHAGRISFDVWLVDGRGSSSNRLSGSIEVVAGGPVHAPLIFGLSYSPSTVSQIASGTVAVNAAVAFVDTGADVSAMRITSSAGTELTVPMPTLKGIQNGTAATTFTLPADKVGRISFALWLVDGLGGASNKLAGIVDVSAGVPSDTWIRLAVTPPATLFGAAWNGRRYVAVGAGGSVMTATDLNGWSVQTSGVGHTLRSVAASPARLVAVGDVSSGEAVVVSSIDGSAWSVAYRAGACQSGSCTTPSQLSKVIWTGTQFIAVGQERIVSAGKLYGLVLTSSDGTTWTQRAPKAIELGNSEFVNERDMTSVAWSGSHFVAIGLGAGLDPAVWVSTNAEAWTAGSIPPEPAVALFPWSDITWGSGRFVAVGNAPGWFPQGAHTPVFTSIDGMSWQASSSSTLLPPMRAVTPGANGYLAVGDANRESSSNGIDWTVTTASGCGNAVLWDGLHYVAVGQSICRSP